MGKLSIGKRKFKYNTTLTNFLVWLLLEKENFKEKLSNDYSSSEKNEFLYNCAIITINDFFTFEKYYVKPSVAIDTLTQDFKDNFKLQQFDKVDVANEVPLNSLKIIRKFNCLLFDINDKQKNQTVKEMKKMITSA